MRSNNIALSIKHLLEDNQRLTRITSRNLELHLNSAVLRLRGKRRLPNNAGRLRRTISLTFLQLTLDGVLLTNSQPLIGHRINNHTTLSSQHLVIISLITSRRLQRSLRSLALFNGHRLVFIFDVVVRGDFFATGLQGFENHKGLACILCGLLCSQLELNGLLTEVSLRRECLGLTGDTS